MILIWRGISLNRLVNQIKIWRPHKYLQLLLLDEKLWLFSWVIMFFWKQMQSVETHTWKITIWMHVIWNCHYWFIHSYSKVVFWTFWKTKYICMMRYLYHINYLYCLKQFATWKQNCKMFLIFTGSTFQQWYFF